MKAKLSVARNANTGRNPRFDLVDFGSEKRVAVTHADTCFWSLIPKEQAVEMMFGDKLRKAFDKHVGAWQKEMDTLRFGLIPSSVYFNPTERCNLNCSYCYLPEKIRHDGGDMSAKQLLHALKTIREHFAATLPKGSRKPEIVFHGSEPLLARDAMFAGIEEFYKDFRFGVQTNATLLDREAVDFLAKYQVGIGISLDAHSAEVANRTRHNWRGDGVFQKVCAAMDLLAGYPNSNVIATVTKANVGSLSKIVEFFHARGISYIMLNPVRCTSSGGRELKPDNAVLAKSFFAALDRSFELYQKTGRKTVISNFANVLIGIVAPTARRLMCDISPCGGGRCFFAVSAQGDVFPCSEFIGIEKFSGGNLYKKSLRDILSSEAFSAVVHRKVEDFAPCAQCAIRHYCGAPCPAEVFSLEGKLDAPSTYCEFYEEQVRYALRVIESDCVDSFLWDGWRDTTQETFSANAF